MTLSDTAIRSLKPTEKTYKKADSGGLYIEVAPSGGVLSIVLMEKKSGFHLVSILM